MIIGIENKVIKIFGQVTLGNIEQAAPLALEMLTKEALSRNMSEEEFAYLIFNLDTNNIAYMNVFSLEKMYGKLPYDEKEKIADGIASLYYKIIQGHKIDENRIKEIYMPTYKRLGIEIPI